MYASLQRLAPRTTNFVTGASVMAVGDTITQTAVEEAKQLDRKRTVCCSSYNACVSVPLAMWYAKADQIWPANAGARTFATKILVNQLLSSAVLSPGFLAWSNSLEVLWSGRPVSEARDVTLATLRREAPSLVATSFCFWLPTNSLMFFAVPQAYRVVFMSTVSVGWGGYCSFVAHRGHIGDSQG